MKPLPTILWLAFVLLLVGCSRPSTTPALPTAATIPITQPTPGQDFLYQSSVGGEPRTGGSWITWSSCGENSQAAVAKANGGRQAGWIILDDLLADPGVLVGALQVESCPQGVALLQGRDTSGFDHNNDPAYLLAGQLLAAQLNLAAGAETCPAAETAVQAAQLLLLSVGFNGAGLYLGPPAAHQDVETAKILVGQLQNYNVGALCR